MGNGPHTLKTACFDAKNPAHGHSHRQAPGRRPRDQPGQPIDCAAACRRLPGSRPAGADVVGWVLVVGRQHEAVLVAGAGRGAIPLKRDAGQDLDRLADVAGLGAGGHIQQLQRLCSVERARQASVPALARNSTGSHSTSSPTWPAGRWWWPGSTRRCWWSGWVSAWSPDRRPQTRARKKATGSTRPAHPAAAARRQVLDQLADAVASAHRLPRRFSQEAASGCPV